MMGRLQHTLLPEEHWEVDHPEKGVGPVIQVRQKVPGKGSAQTTKEGQGQGASAGNKETQSTTSHSLSHSCASGWLAFLENTAYRHSVQCVQGGEDDWVIVRLLILQLIREGLPYFLLNMLQRFEVFTIKENSPHKIFIVFRHSFNHIKPTTCKKGPQVLNGIFISCVRLIYPIFSHRI